MNTLKPLLIVAVLAGIGYGVYIRINSGNDAPPPGVADGWNTSPQVQLGAGPAGGAPAPWPGAGSSPGGAAPPFAQGTPAAGAVPPSDPATAPGAAAPPFGDPATTAPASTDQAQIAPPANPSGSPPPGATSPPAAENGLPPQDAGVADRYRMPEPASPDQYQVPTAGAPDRNAVPGATNSAAMPPDAGAPNGAAPDRYQTPQPEPGVVYPAAEAAATAATQPPAQAPADGSFNDALAAAQRDLEAGQMAAALEQLSLWYGDARLTPAEHQQLNQLLDQVAGTVIYSTQHLLEPPYEVQPGERLEDIGQRYSVPWQLLAKINGIDDPNNLRPGERLKVIRGPFGAVINLEKRELTLTLANGAYAGRFPIGIGRDQPPREGSFAVSDKVDNPVYRGQGKTVGAGEQDNPLGQHWIGLGSDLGIHGTDRPENIGRTDLPGSISLSPHDLQDVFDILAAGSKVTIRR